MTKENVDDFLTAERTCRMAAVTGSGLPHVAPLWFVRHGDSVWIFSIVGSPRWKDVTNNPDVAIVDTGERFDELRGVEIVGAGTVVGEVPRVADPIDELAEPERLFALKYTGDRQFRQRPTARVAEC